MKRIFEVTTPIKALYLVSGCYPIKYQIKARRVMYLHYLLNRNPTELISKIDWYCSQGLKRAGTRLLGY